jgi:hypothetical protein
MRAMLEPWLVEDGKVEELAPGDTLVAGLEITLDTIAPSSASAPHVKYLAQPDDNGAEGALHEVVGHPAPFPVPFSPELWYLRVMDLRLAPTTEEWLPAQPEGMTLVRGTVLVSWRHLGQRDPIARGWSIRRVTLQKAPRSEHGNTPRSTGDWSRSVSVEVDRINVSRDFSPAYEHRYLLDLEPREQ